MAGNRITNTPGDGWDADQLREIEAGIHFGVDISVYAKKEFLAIQMQQIRLGLEEGLDVSVYARPEYDWFQMEEIRKGLSSGLDVSVYAKPDITYDRMRQVRKGLSEGIDLAKFVKLDARILRQLRKAYVSKVNIIDFVVKGYEAEQLDEIRIALEKGLDIEPYLIKEFRGVSIHEIVLGLEEGLEVSRYAKMTYSWQQMREIRLGLELRLDTSQYENPMYSKSQMKELRLGLEAGLDISGYRSLMYTAKDMEKARLRLLEEYAREIVAGSKQTFSLKNFLISVSADETEAYLEVRANKGRKFELQDLMDALQEEGITAGILPEAVEAIIAEEIYNQPVLVAKGEPAVKGKDGYYEYFFNTEKCGKPKLNEDGSVDYQNVRMFEMVQEHQRLAYYHPATEGQAGMTVRGKVLHTVRGKEEKVLTGKGFILMHDKRTYVSALSGKVELDEEKHHMDVTAVCIMEEVTPATGNVEFDGCVYVLGDVMRGTSITATGDVVIDGGVEACTIRCGGELLLRQGANGKGEGFLAADKSVAGKFFEAISVQAGKDIRANYCLNCHLKAHSEIIISGRKGILAGGVAKALKGIQCYHVGNRAQIKTYIQLGVNDEILSEQKLLQCKIDTVQKELSTLGNALIKFQRLYPPEVRNAMEIYLKVEDAIYTKELEQERLYKRKLHNEESMSRMSGAKAVIYGYLYEGCVFEIDKKYWESSLAKNVTIRKRNDRIAIFHNV